MMLVSFPVGVYTVFGAHLSNNYTASTPIYGINLDVVFTSVQVPVSGNLGVLFLVCSVAYLACVILALKQGIGFWRSLRGAATQGYEALFTNPMAAMMVLLGATSLVTLLVDTAQNSAGISTGSLTGDPFSLLVDFTLAPLLEETSFRLIMIGVPVLVLGLVMFREFSPRKIVKALWRPSSLWDADEADDIETVASFETTGPSLFPARAEDSTKIRAIRPVVYAFLVLSSIMFGYAHYASGSGWGPGKISEAALAGLALGYLYIKYGLHTSLLLHWSIDYVGSIFSFFAQAVWGVPWTSNTGNPLDYIPTVVIVFLLGGSGTLIVFNELLKRVLKGKAPI